MGMTQEEIEALMNGTIGDEQESSSSIDLDDIDALVDSASDEVTAEVSNGESESIDDILAGIDGVVDDSKSESTDEDSNIDDMLAGIDGVVDDAPLVESSSTPQVSEEKSSEDLGAKIEKGIYPMPVEKEHKVVSQLNQVAEDSEEKASQIFDVLSFILDENDGIGRNLSLSSDFIDNQVVLLNKLTEKFPNVEVFSESLVKANEAKSGIDQIQNTLMEESNKLFEAMELMQFHDINRQKIERVMAVIRKLSNYLNGLFEDDSDKPEVQIAQHISGDSHETVTADDLDALISQYSKED
jgi:hypothetical protein